MLCHRELAPDSTWEFDLYLLSKSKFWLLILEIFCDSELKEEREIL